MSSSNDEESHSASPSPLDAQLPAPPAATSTTTGGPVLHIVQCAPDQFTSTPTEHSDEENESDRDKREEESPLPPVSLVSHVKKTNSSSEETEKGEETTDEMKERDEKKAKAKAAEEPVFLNVMKPSASPLMLLYSVALQAPRYLFFLLHILFLSSFFLALYHRFLLPALATVDATYYPNEDTHLLQASVWKGIGYWSSPFRWLQVTFLLLSQLNAFLFEGNFQFTTLLGKMGPIMVALIKDATKVDLSAEWRMIRVGGSSSSDSPLLSYLTDRETGVRLLRMRALLWRNPATAFVAFGLLFYASSFLLTVWELLHALMVGAKNIQLCVVQYIRTWIYPKEKTSFSIRRRFKLWLTDLYQILFYGNGYHSLLRLAFALLEIAWFMQFNEILTASPYPAGSYQKAQDHWSNCWGFTALKAPAVAAKGNKNAPTPPPNKQTKNTASLSTSWNAALIGSARCYIRHPTLALRQYPILLAGVRLLLIVVAIVEVQRLFNALVGVRPFAMRDGWERCPLCQVRWRQSHRSSLLIHQCPVLLNKSSVKRVGDNFADPNRVSFWSRITYSWMNSFLSVALCTPLGFFGVPADVEKKKDAQTYWAVLEEVTQRLPRLPRDMECKERLDKPAWALWRFQNKSKKELKQLKQEGKLPPELPTRTWAESLFLGITAPFRKILSRAFVLFFLPPSVRKQKKQNEAADEENVADPIKQTKKEKKKGLFQLFMQHPSGKQFVYICVPLKLLQDFLSLVAPQVVKRLVDFLREVGLSASDPNKAPPTFFGKGMTVVGLLVVVVLLQVIVFQYYLAHLYSSSMKATASLKALLLRQTLVTPAAFSFQPASVAKKVEDGAAGRSPGSPFGSPKISPRQGSESPKAEKAAAQGSLSKEGEAVSLLSIDAGNCGECLIFLHNVWGHPLVIFSSLITMYRYVGVVATACTFLTLVALIPFNRYSASLVRVAQAGAKNNGSRISDLTTSLVSMRTVKSMALEGYITERISTARKAESDGMGKVIRAEGFAAAHTELTTLIISLVCFGSYLIAGGKMDAAVFVPTMAALNVMRFPVWTLPHVFSQVSKGYNSMKRIEAYLGLEEEEEDHEEENEKKEENKLWLASKWNGIEYAARTAEVRRTSAVGTVSCNGCSFCWTKPRRYTREDPAPPVIHDIQLEVKPGEFILLQGSTGSGKSALLLAMLGEMYPIPPAHQNMEEDSYVGFRVGGRVMYCAEIPWLRNRTVRENIRMLPDSHPETEEERKWFNEVIRACGMNSDLSAMAMGAMTVVGEGGGRLSGGQRARVALARAVYNRSNIDVFLFDDILSALDVEVQKHIITEVFRGLLKSKTIIMASHVAPHTLLPDRLFAMKSAGTLREVPWTKPSDKEIERLEQSWRKATPQRSTSVLSSSTRSMPEVQQRIRESKRLKRRDERDKRKRMEKLRDEGALKKKEEEDKGTQSFSLIPSKEDLYTLFIRFMGAKSLFLVILSSVVLQAVRSLTDNWLGIWFSIHREVYDDKTISGSTAHFLHKAIQKVLSFVNVSPPPATPPPTPSRFFFMRYLPSLDTVVLQFLLSYAAIGILASVLSYFRTRTFFLSYQRIANALQFHAVTRIFKAPVSYFDRVPSSGLLQILSRDQDVVDRNLGESIQLIFTSTLQMLGVIVFSSSQQSAFIAVVPICVFLFYNLTLRFLLTSKQVRTLEGKLGAMSMEVLKESVTGAVTVRAYGEQAVEQLQEEMDATLDNYNTAGYIGLMSDRWVGLRLEVVSLLLTSTLALLSVFSACFPVVSGVPKKIKVDKGAVSAGAAFAGLGVVSSMSAARALSMLCRRIGLFQTQYVSAEQLLRLYREVPQEGEEEEAASLSVMNQRQRVTKALLPLDQHWSQRLFSKLSQLPPVLRVDRLNGKYQSHLPYVLTNITFSLRPGECIGLIGRSGNGKSSLFNALLQLMDVLQGSIGIPHLDPSGTLTERTVNANALKLPHKNVKQLRQNYFQLVSQEPFLLQGTIRSNLLLGIEEEDKSLTPEQREERYGDKKLWKTLKKVQFEQMFFQTLPETTHSSSGSRSPPESHSEGETAPPSGNTSLVSSFDSEETAEAQFLLDYEIQAQGTNLSAGQRQLLCLARTLLREPRVVLLDEVSSRVDQTTDQLIQDIITEEILLRKREGTVLSMENEAETPERKVPYYSEDITPEPVVFSNSSDEDISSEASTVTGEQEGGGEGERAVTSTSYWKSPKRNLRAPSGVLLIAHRLNTIMSLCDRVLVVDDGCIVADLNINEVSAIEDLESLL